MSQRLHVVSVFDFKVGNLISFFPAAGRPVDERWMAAASGSAGVCCLNPRLEANGGISHCVCML